MHISDWSSDGCSSDLAVFGYTIFNDITSNGMRAEDMFHYYALYASKDDPTQTERVEQHLSYAGRYKGSDTFGPMGPWVVTRDEELGRASCRERVGKYG